MNATFTREYIASYPDNVIGIWLTSDKKKSMTFDVSLTALHEGFTTIAKDNGTIELNVKVKGGALSGTSMLKVTAKGGEITTSREQVAC